MSTNIVNHSPYLRTSRSFPEDDSHQLAVEINRSYVDIASKVNAKSIGLYPTKRPAINGDEWYLDNIRKNQGFRQVYQFTGSLSDNGTINLGFKISSIAQFTPNCYGTYTASSGDWYGIPYATDQLITGLITFWLHVNSGSTTSDQIKFRVDGAAPTAASGMVVIEWLSEI